MKKALLAAAASALFLTATPALAQDGHRHERHERWERHDDDRGRWERRDGRHWERRDRRDWGRYDRRWGYERRWRYRGRDCDYMGYGGRGYDCRSYGDYDSPYIILRLFNDIICYTRSQRSRVVCPRDWYDY